MKDTVLKLRISSDTKSDLKDLCERENKSMSNWLTEKIEEEVRRDKKDGCKKTM